MGRLSDLFSKRSVDDRLLSGELSPDSGKGKARANQLVSPRHRAKAARGLNELVKDAWRPRPSFFNANLVVRRLGIRENQALILTLAKELEELPAVNPRGVILADRLVNDGESPAYYVGGQVEDHSELINAVQEARAALKA